MEALAPPKTLDRPLYVGLWATSVGNERILQYHVDKQENEDIEWWDAFRDNIPIWGTSAKLEKAIHYWESADGKGQEYLAAAGWSFVDDVGYVTLVDEAATGGLKLLRAGALAKEAGSAGALARTGVERELGLTGRLASLERAEGRVLIVDVTKADLVKGLRGTTKQAELIADAIEQGRFRVSIVGDDLYSKMVAESANENAVTSLRPDGTVDIYLRKSDPRILSTTVEEGTHALDFLDPNMAGKTRGQVEVRGKFHARVFQKTTGMPLTHQTNADILNFIRANYQDLDEILIPRQ